MSGNSKLTGMKKTPNMSFIEILNKRLDRKKVQLSELETIMSSGGQMTPADNRKYIELKANIQELETVIDLAETLLSE